MRVSPEDAMERLKRGEVVALPTETVYGLAASIEHPHAIERIFELKKRPRDNPLILHSSSFETLLPYLHSPTFQIKPLTEAFWPGPLTLVLPAKTELLPPAVTAGLSTIAVRVPNHPLTRHILEKSGPLVAPSANLSGRPSATSQEHVEMDFGKEFPVVDGGSCSKGVESTILSWNEKEHRWQILRLGAISAEQLSLVLGEPPIFVQKSSSSAPLCPGTKYRHYSPVTPLKSGPPPLKVGVAIGFQERNYPFADQVLILGSLKDPQNVAQNLYSTLRQLDQLQVPEAWIDLDLPQMGLWTTLRERMVKATHP